jgi:UDP:flavonoid glycosyltransferase YjiC (YdhE family)
VVFTLGSTAVHIGRDFYQSAAEAARLLGRRAILLVGKNPPPPDLGGQGVALDYVPLGSVLPRAAAVVHHGGIGTCAETLRAGLPSLIVPFGFDQPDNAERLRRLGVARILRRDRVSCETLVTGLRAVLSTPGLAARARELSRQVQPEIDLNRSLDAIEGICGPGKVPSLS